MRSVSPVWVSICPANLLDDDAEADGGLVTQHFLIHPLKERIFRRLERFVMVVGL